MGLLTQLALQNISNEEKFSLLNDISGVIRKIAIAVALENMPQNDLDIFKNLLINQIFDEKLFLEFVLARVPNFESLFKSEVERFYNELIIEKNE